MTGLIFAVIAAFWLMYLVPYFLHHRNAETAEDEADAAIPFTPEVTIVRSESMVVRVSPDLASRIRKRRSVA